MVFDMVPWSPQRVYIREKGFRVIEERRQGYDDTGCSMETLKASRCVVGK